MNKKSYIILTIIIFNIFTFCFSFSEVPADHPSYKELNYLISKGIIPGTEFKKGETVNRYYFSTKMSFLLKLMEKDSFFTKLTEEDIKTIESLTKEYSNELEFYGHRLNKIDKIIKNLKEDVKNYKENINNNIEIEQTYDYRVRSDNFDYNVSTDPIVKTKDVRNLNHTLGINTNVNMGNGVTYFTRTEISNIYGNSNGLDINIAGNVAIVTNYLEMENNMSSLSLGRQFFNLGNALLYSSKGNGIKYSKILDENSDLVLMSVKEDNNTSNALNTHAINYLKYYDNSTVNFYYLNSTGARWNNASQTLSTDSLFASHSDVSSINYFGVSYKQEETSNKFFAELCMSEYTDDVLDYTTNPARTLSGKIGTQYAYHMGISSPVTRNTDIRFIYTHYDDYFKRYKVDPTITAPYYDELGYGGIYGGEILSDSRSGAFDSYFIRYESYLSENSQLFVNLETIKDQSPLGLTQFADDRNVFGVKFIRTIKDCLLSFEYTEVNVETASGTNDIKINGTGQEQLSIAPYPTSISEDGYDPYNQKSLRITGTYSF